MKSFEERRRTVECRIIGVYPVSMTKQELRQIVKRNPHFTVLTFDYLWGLYEKLYLFEVWVSDSGTIDSFINEITQDNEEGQAPYLEAYFDQDGLLIIQRPSEGSIEPCRLCFFLHYVDLDSNLDIADQLLPLPAPTPIPPRLASCMTYEPPN